MKKLLILIWTMSFSALLSMAQLSEVDPIFPETFDVTADVETVKINQTIDEDWECPMLEVTGETVNETVKLTFALPEGWDGVVGCVMMDGGMKQKPGVKKSAPAQWTPMEEFESYMEGAEIQKGLELEFKADGVSHNGNYFLYVGDQVDMGNPFLIAVNVTRTPQFPESLDVTADSEKVEISQAYEEEDGVIFIMATGQATDGTVKFTFDVPEGWNGLIGGVLTGSDMKYAKGVAAEDDEDDQTWVDLEMFTQVMGEQMELQKGNEFEFPADGQNKMAVLYLYAGEKVYTPKGVQLAMIVDPGENVGVESLDAVDGAARYFNLQGVEVSDPIPGVYVKVADGKVSKVIVKK